VQVKIMTTRATQNIGRQMTREASLERDQRLFEDYPGCPRVPPPAIQQVTDGEIAGLLSRLGVVNTALSRRIIRSTLAVSGFERFLKRLPDQFDALTSKGGPTSPPNSLSSAAVQSLADADGMREPLHRAACLLAAAWNLHSAIREGSFAPDRYRDRPLESRLYLNLFGTSVVCDGGTFRLFKTSNVSRIAVLARGRTFVVDFGCSSEGPSIEALERALTDIWESSSDEQGAATATSIGIVTCANSSTQLNAFRTLLREPRNRTSLDLLNHTFFTVCLDLDVYPDSDADVAAAAFTRKLANRWFGASLQLVVFGNAKAAVISSFAAIPSGAAMIRAGSELLRRSITLARSPRARDDGSPQATAQEIRWHTDGLSLEAVEQEVQQLLDDQPATSDITGIQRASLETAGIGPTELFVTAVQLATSRLIGRCPTVEQFVATSTQCCGGVATAPVTTPEADAVLQLVDDPNADPSAVRAAFFKAAEAQRVACRNARARLQVLQVAQSHELFLESRGRFGRLYATAVYVTASLIVRAAGLRRKRSEAPAPPGRPTMTDIVVSHPGTILDVPVVGRPSVRVPYCALFGLHYQIFDDRIRVTLMRGTEWSTPNATLFAELEASFTTLLDRLGLVEAPASTVSM
jgi:hypothetical protein